MIYHTFYTIQVGYSLPVTLQKLHFVTSVLLYILFQIIHVGVYWFLELDTMVCVLCYFCLTTAMQTIVSLFHRCIVHQNFFVIAPLHCSISPLHCLLECILCYCTWWLIKPSIKFEVEFYCIFVLEMEPAFSTAPIWKAIPIPMFKMIFSNFF